MVVQEKTTGIVVLYTNEHPQGARAIWIAGQTLAPSPGPRGRSHFIALLGKEER